VREGENGFLVPAGSAVDIAESVEKLLESESLRSRMGGSGRTIVRETFTMERMARKNELFYRQICSEGDS
jgi:glycosyltransferase involved in cell wall biosynthesis